MLFLVLLLLRVGCHDILNTSFVLFSASFWHRYVSIPEIKEFLPSVVSPSIRLAFWLKETMKRGVLNRDNMSRAKLFLFVLRCVALEFGLAFYAGLVDGESCGITHTWGERIVRILNSYGSLNVTPGAGLLPIKISLTVIEPVNGPPLCH
jgi:hypothetical protein